MILKPVGIFFQSFNMKAIVKFYLIVMIVYVIG